MVDQFTDFLLKIFFMRMNIDRNDKRSGTRDRSQTIGVLMIDRICKRGKTRCGRLTCSKSADFIRLPVPFIQLYLHLDVGMPKFRRSLCQSKNQM